VFVSIKLEEKGTKANEPADFIFNLSTCLKVIHSKSVGKLKSKLSLRRLVYEQTKYLPSDPPNSSICWIEMIAILLHQGQRCLYL
jgi:hypothetical protein